jgi:hypothetical protein
MVNQGLFDRNELVLNAGTVKTLETSDYRVDFMIICVTQGVLDMFYGPNALSGVPIRFSANQPPSWLPVGLQGDKMIVTFKGSDPGNLQTLANVIFVSQEKVHFRG